MFLTVGWTCVMAKEWKNLFKKCSTCDNKIVLLRKIESFGSHCGTRSRFLIFWSRGVERYGVGGGNEKDEYDADDNNDHVVVVVVIEDEEEEDEEEV